MLLKEIIGLDVGMATTGLARASTTARLPEPLMSLPTDKVVSKVRELMGKSGLEAIVVGLPRNLSGEDTAQTKWVRDWVDKTKPRLPIPFFWQDEAITSRHAAKLQTSKFKNQKFDEHALAAAIILQDFLDTPENERVRC